MKIIILCLLILYVYSTPSPVEVLNCTTRAAALYKQMSPGLMNATSFMEAKILLSEEKNLKNLKTTIQSCNFILPQFKINNFLVENCFIQLEKGYQSIREAYSQISEKGLDTETFSTILRLITPYIMAKDVCQGAFYSFDTSEEEMKVDAGKNMENAIQSTKDLYTCSDKLHSSYVLLHGKYQQSEKLADIKDLFLNVEALNEVQQTLYACGYTLPEVAFDKDHYQGCKDKISSFYTSSMELYNQYQENGLDLQNTITGMDLYTEMYVVKDKCHELIKSVDLLKVFDYFLGIEGDGMSSKCNRMFNQCLQQYGKNQSFGQKLCKKTISEDPQCGEKVK